VPSATRELPCLAQQIREALSGTQDQKQFNAQSELGLLEGAHVRELNRD
jgi:hypothetical protein